MRRIDWKVNSMADSGSGSIFLAGLGTAPLTAPVILLFADANAAAPDFRSAPLPINSQKQKS